MISDVDTVNVEQPVVHHAPPLHLRQLGDDRTVNFESNPRQRVQSAVGQSYLLATLARIVAE